MSILFRRPSGARVEVGDGALLKLLRFRQAKSTAHEAGGVLLGRYVVDGEDVVVDDVTEPFAADRRARTFFKRAAHPHQKAIDAAWTKSGGRSHYLGEWHSHPEDVPNPSETDLRDWKRRLRKDQFDADRLLFMIVGIRMIVAWEGVRQSTTIIRLSHGGSL